MTVSSMARLAGSPEEVGALRFAVQGVLYLVDTPAEIAVGEAAILLTPPLYFSRCFNRDKQGMPGKLTELSPTARLKTARSLASRASTGSWTAGSRRCHVAPPRPSRC